MTVGLDVIVRSNGGHAPLGPLVALRRQGTQRRAVEFLEELPPAGLGHPPHLLVDRWQELTHRCLGLVHAEEDAIAQARQDQTFSHQHARLDRGLVPVIRTSG